MFKYKKDKINKHLNLFVYIISKHSSHNCYYLKNSKTRNNL